MEEVFRCEIASNSLTDTGLRIYDRDTEIGKEHGFSRSFGLCKNGLRFSCKKQVQSTIELQKSGLKLIQPTIYLQLTPVPSG